MNNTDALILLLGLLKKSFDVSEEMVTLAKVLGANQKMLQGAFNALRLHEHEYTFKPLLQSEYVFNFDEDEQVVTVTFANQTVKFEFEQFLQYLGRIDAAASPIYPIGTVIQISQEFVPKELLEMTQISDESTGYVMITGRKVQLIDEFDQYVVDYLGLFWPFGNLKMSQPMMISNMMIDQVVQMGYSNTDEIQYEEMLHMTQVSEEQISTAFMTKGMQQVFIENAREHK